MKVKISAASAEKTIMDQVAAKPLSQHRILAAIIMVGGCLSLVIGLVLFGWGIVIYVDPLTKGNICTGPLGFVLLSGSLGGGALLTMIGLFNLRAGRSLVEGRTQNGVVAAAMCNGFLAAVLLVLPSLLTRLAGVLFAIITGFLLRSKALADPMKQ